MKSFNVLLLIILGIFILVTVKTEEPIDFIEQTKNPKHIPLLSWTWELPDDLFSEYPLHDYSYWSTGCTINSGVRFVHLRNSENNDELHAGAYVSFRPFAFYFKDSLLILGICGGFDSTWNEGRMTLDFENLYDVVSTDNIPFNISFSAMWSFPKHGLQLEVEIGHYWSRMTSKDKKFNFHLPPIPIGFEGTLTQLQEDTGISMYAGIRMVSERRFLTGFEMVFTGSCRTGHVDVTTKITKIRPNLLNTDLSISGKPTPTDVMISLFYLKAMAIDVSNIIPVSTGKKQFVLLEPVGGVSYLSWQHGHGIIAGVRLNIIDSIGFSYFHSFKQKNDSPDVDVFRVEIGLEIGGRLSSLSFGP